MIVLMIPETTVISSFTACQHGPARSSQIQRPHRCKRKCRSKHETLSSCTYSIKRVGVKKNPFGSSISLPWNEGFGLNRTVITEAQKDEEHRELEKVGNKSIELWSSPIPRMRTVLGIFTTTFRWTFFFFGISLMDDGASGGRSSRRRPR